ncbi:murein transglycosylase A [Limnobacter sp.]|uniref:murein transglycosylase A n=1 Tax=Limnobacter sp. TaxID=2003368 RepID=UPI0035191D72
MKKNLRISKAAKTGLLVLILAGCASSPQPTTTECKCPPTREPAPAQAEAPTALPLWAKSDFSKLPGWESANHIAYLQAFAKQCATDSNTLGKRKTTPPPLLEACKKTGQFLGNQGQGSAKRWMETNFEVWQFQQEDGSKQGLLTGYFEPVLQGSRKPSARFNAPLYGVPSELITVKLDELYPDLKGKRLRGRLQGDSLVPFFSRAEWERVGPNRERPLVWVDDKLDAFLLQVQGSGRVQLTDGSTIRLSYAEQNGHPYKSIGKVLVDRGELSAAQATIPGIRQWAKANPQRLDALLNENPSVVFFKENAVLRPEDGPIGALGVPLTAELSVAIDRQRVPYGSLLWVESSNPVTGKPIEQAALAQDTGGAIRGRVRADYYWGTGEAAGQAAGLMRQPLHMWLFWPKGHSLPTEGN